MVQILMAVCLEFFYIWKGYLIIHCLYEKTLYWIDKHFLTSEKYISSGSIAEKSSNIVSYNYLVQNFFQRTWILDSIGNNFGEKDNKRFQLLFCSFLLFYCAHFLCSISIRNLQERSNGCGFHLLLVWFLYYSLRLH